MINDNEFIDSIELATSNRQRVLTRFDKWRIALQNIIGVDQKEPRCFSRIIKEQLFRLDNTCAICEQKIVDVDDSAVDHIEQYWLGGKTIPENARLTHRYCNNARSRNDGVNFSAINQIVRSAKPGITEIIRSGHRSPSGHTKIIVTLNWKLISNNKELEIIDEGNASKTLVKTLESIYSFFGSEVFEKAITQMNGKLPFLSKNPDDYFRANNKENYTSEEILNSGISVLTHTNTPEKKKELEKFIDLIDLPSKFIDIEIVKK